MLNRYLLLVTFGLLFSTACTRLPNIQGKGEASLQGFWLQDSSALQKLQNYTVHQFKITCDSFYLNLTTHAKVNYYEEACFNNGLWQEYAKGTYQLRNDTLVLVGDFTNAKYKQKVSGCYRNGRYIANFKVKAIGKDSIALENMSDQMALKLRLKEEIVCVQKAL